MLIKLALFRGTKTVKVLVFKIFLKDIKTQQVLSLTFSSIKC